MQTSLADFEPGGYRYLPGGFQYSAAVMAAPGLTLERVRFRRPVPLAEGFARIAAHLGGLGRPLTALCACELRIPRPLEEADFVAFNRGYVEPLTAWGLVRGDTNPVARCNLCPADGSVAEPSFYAFSYTVPTDAVPQLPSFISSGAAECPDQPNYREHIVRLGERSPDALRDKLHFALGDLESRLAAMGLSWADVLSTRLYTVHDLHPLMGEAFAPRGALAGGLEWHWVRPPVQDLEIEIDARAIWRERVI